VVKKRPGTSLQVLLPIISIAALSANAADAPPPLRLAQTVQTYNLTLPLIFQGVYLGDVPVAASPDGNVAINVDRFITMLGARLTPTMAGNLKAAAADQSVIGPDVFAKAGITITYDTGKLELRVTIPVEQQGGQSVSAMDQQQQQARGPSPSTIAPATVSASLTLTARQAYIWTPSTAQGFDPFRVSADFAGNLFGNSGVYLFAQGEYDEAANDPFHRGNAVMVYDDLEDALRFSLGDVAPASAGFQAAPVLGGLSIQRQFGELQPFRNIRPSGLFRFSLDRASTVDVVVNGTTIRTLRLDAGQFDLKDFPLFNGLNDVELYVVDEFGRKLIASFSQFFSTQLLNPGIFEFGATMGLPQTRDGGDTLTYDDRNLTFSGYARYGLLQEITLGANLQMDRNQWLSGTEIGWASPIGTVGLQAGLSNIDGVGQGHSFLVNYEASAKEAGPLKNPQVNISWLTTSEHFASLGTLTPSETVAWEARGRMSAQVPLNLGLGLSASYAHGRNAEPDERRYGLSLTRNFEFADLTASGERTERDGTDSENRLLLSLSLPIGERENVRTSYDTSNDQVLADYSRYQRNELNDYGLRASVQRDRDRVTGTGEFAFNANRASILVQHDAISDAGLSTITSQRTSYTIGTQLAFADGAVAVGRPVGQRFAIVTAHPTLRGSDVGVSQSRSGRTREAETDFLGSALVSAGSAYQPQSVFIDVEDLPQGYNVGTGQYELFPGLASGYKVTVGSDAAYTVVGTLIGADHKPLALLGGEVRAINDPSFKPVLVFTNSVGKFFAEGLKPGRYQMVLGPAMDIVVPIEVPPGTTNVVNAGTLTVQDHSS
jgi:outer membrane usher protein